MTADWYSALIGTRCGSCDVLVPAASPVRRMRTGGLRCADCTKRLLGEDVPSHLAALNREIAPLPQRVPYPLQPFVERLRQALASDTPDFKQRAGGDDDDAHHHRSTRVTRRATRNGTRRT